MARKGSCIAMVSVSIFVVIIFSTANISVDWQSLSSCCRLFLKSFSNCCLFMAMVELSVFDISSFFIL